jgi:hypothetical protein
VKSKAFFQTKFFLMGPGPITDEQHLFSLLTFFAVLFIRIMSKVSGKSTAALLGHIGQKKRKKQALVRIFSVAYR